MLNMYKNTSDNRVIDKALEVIATNMPCAFKDNVNAMRPVIIISPEIYSPNCNYVYIDDTDRFYYVVDVVFSQQRVELVLSCDVLMSFADDIKNSMGVCVRSSNRYNNYFRDNQVTALTYNNYYVHKFPHGFNKTMSNVLVLGGTG